MSSLRFAILRSMRRDSFSQQGRPSAALPVSANCCWSSASPGLEFTLDHVLRSSAGGIQRAGEVEHRKHRKDREKVERHRRDEARALAGDIAAGHFPGRHASIGRVRHILPSKLNRPWMKSWKKAAERPVDVRLLPAGSAIRPRQRRAAVEAASFVRMPVAPPPRHSARRHGQAARRSPHRRSLRIRPFDYPPYAFSPSSPSYAAVAARC